MKQILLVLVLLIATVCFATERLVFLSGDSEESIMSMQIPPPGDYECTELLTPIVGSPICDMFPGEWVGNGAWMAEHSIQPDRAAYALGCNNGDTELNGGRFKGNRQGFLDGLQYALTTEAQGGIPGETYKDKPRDEWNKDEIDDIVPMYCRWLKRYAMQQNDILHLWVQGTAGMVVVDGIETPCFYLAWGDDWPEPPACETYGGELLVPSYTGTNSHILGLKQVLDAIEGDGTIVLYLVFARAGAWIAYLDDYIVWAGVEANEYVYIANGADENQMYWPGYQENDFYVLEPSMWIANAWKCYRNTDGEWDPHRFDTNGDYHIWFSEACNATELLDDQHGTALNVPVGKDFKIWSMYPDDDPMGGGDSPPAPNIWPNPFNPTTSIAIEMPSAGEFEASVFNVLGQHVERLFDGKLPAGRHHFVFYGHELPSGIYFLRTQQQGQFRVQKMVLQK